MSRFAAINLAMVPLPQAVEVLDFEAIVAAMKADLVSRMPELAAVVTLESDPINKLVEVCAYRELLLRARVNDAVRAVHLATATGADLDNLAALFGVVRLVVTPANPATQPPTAAVMETDPALRLRTQLALDGFSTAGSRAAYEFHARSADARVLDVSVDNPASGEVRVVILSNVGDGAASPDLLASVTAALNAEEVRPICDLVSVQSATIVPFVVNASLTVLDGPDQAVVLASAEAALARYLADLRAVGRDVRLSGIYAALHQAGVEAVTLAAPLADIAIGPTQAAHCTGTTVTIGGVA